MNIDVKEIQGFTFSEIRKVHEHHVRSTKKHLDDNPGDHYRVDRHNVMNYFGIFPKWRERVITLCSQLKKIGKLFSYIDICGRASGRLLDASVSYLFSLKTDDLDRILSDPNDIFIDGDIFKSADFNKLLQKVRMRGIQPAYATFMPMAGLQSYTPWTSIKIPTYEAVTYAILAKRLAAIIDILLPGGLIMIERPFQFDGGMAEAYKRIPQNQYKLSIALKKFARKNKCKIEILSEISGPYFLIQKSTN